ncbi:MAG: peptidoglycan editing factor PgeF [Oscillospiraceae bacterium]
MHLTTVTKQGVPFLRCDAIPCPHGFSTRLGGVSTGVFSSMNLGTTRGDDPQNVRENYRRFCDAIGTDCSKIVMSNQVHSCEIRAVTSADVKPDLYAPEGYETDGLITDVPGLCLTIFAADCLPVLLCDPVRQVICAVHAGWRGTAGGIAKKAVHQMMGYGCRPQDILAAIGPGIDRCCFETHRDVPDAMTALMGPAAAPFFTPLPEGKFHVDLKGMNRQILLDSGVLPQHLAISDDCTCCLPEKYWSHRFTGGVRGSQVAMLQLPAQEGDR